jgi:hypothetical protein
MEEMLSRRGSSGSIPTKKSKRFSLSFLSRPLSPVPSSDDIDVGSHVKEDDVNHGGEEGVKVTRGRSNTLEGLFTASASPLHRTVTKGDATSPSVEKKAKRSTVAFGAEELREAMKAEQKKQNKKSKRQDKEKRRSLIATKELVLQELLATHRRRAELKQQMAEQAEEERRKEEKRRERLLLPIDGVADTLKKRHMVINEIINTEKDYVYDLQVLLTVFMTPLLNEGILTPDEISAIFSNAKLLVSVNKMLLADLIKRIKANQGYDVGESFILLGDYLKMYATYCTNQETAGEVVTRAEKTNPRFRAFLQKALADPQTNRLLLRDYLIKPMQRICKYPLFLRELINHTDRDHPDYDNLTHALDKIHNVVMSVNENKKQEENVETMAKTIGRLKGAERFGIQMMVPGRKFVQEGTLLASSGEEFKPKHYLLFSDLMVLADKKGSSRGTKDKSSSKLEVAAVVPLLGSSEVNLRATEDNGTTVSITTGEETYILPFPTAELKKKWTQALMAMERSSPVPSPQMKKREHQ